MTRKPLMAGNWKMNLTHVEAVGLVQKLTWTLDDKRWDPARSEVVVLPPFTDLRTVQTLVEGDRLKIGYGAQDVSVHARGAYTGEISVEMLAKLNCGYVAVGHSERREYHGEDDAVVNAKAKQALSGGVTPIICVGEGLAERDAGETDAVIARQVAAAFASVEAGQAADCVVAYEPIWAIGSGRAADGAEANRVAGIIRATLAAQFGAERAGQIRIQYGGSVTDANIAEFIGQPEIDGALVGGASLKAETFIRLCALAAGGAEG